MPQPHRSLTAPPAVAATAAAVALVSSCSSSAPTSEQHPSITFGSQVSTTPGMVGQGPAHARMYQAVSARAAAVREVFTTTLAISAGSYAATEAANTIAAG